jgi:hypothetical protein
MQGRGEGLSSFSILSFQKYIYSFSTLSFLKIFILKKFNYPLYHKVFINLYVSVERRGLVHQCVSVQSLNAEVRCGYLVCKRLCLYCVSRKKFQSLRDVEVGCECERVVSSRKKVII